MEATRKALRMGLKIGSPTALLELIVEQLVNAVAQHAENIAVQLDTIEEKIAADSCGRVSGKRSAMCAGPRFVCIGRW